MVKESNHVLISRTRFVFLSTFVAVVCALCGIAFSGEAAHAATPGQTTTSSTASVAEGWQKSGNGWWYRYADSSFAKGMKKIGTNYYFFDNNGWMKTGWQHAKGNSDWYYFAGSGAMKTAWQKISGKWYFFNSDGKMLTGKQTLPDGKTYFFNKSGAMQTGWAQSGSDWYYCDGSGAMKIDSWISGKYWVGSNGTMVRNGWVDGGKYFVDDNGVKVSNKHNTGITTASDKALVQKMVGSWYFDMGAELGVSSSLGSIVIYADGGICDKNEYQA